ncbi:DUF983 domain-containing protein [uncultured Tenacibaculum sp.]|uniref:DUF983 domain-containing protein n=2 Tax=Tenacibaculum TaxID=104267 RepID=UPI001045BA6B|nr:DUF983 domain-containing protein [uncultured Tenacibaculum sp.]TCI95096.1 DUF983 domain-containing protein [Tenacibaculum sp. M341]
MLGKGTKLYSVTRMKCPKCNEGSFFVGHPYKFSTLGEVKEKCSVCDLKYSIEPWFFQGSYYVSYALGVALFVAIFILKIVLLPKLTYLITLISMVVILLMLSPLLFALSKIIWINIFVHYDSRFKR